MRAAGLVALVLGATISASIVFAQPLRSPWWTYADADATYSAASLNLLYGVQIRYLDHPGLPLEELGAIVFGAEDLAQRATGRVDSRQEFVDGNLLHLDRARPVFRGLAGAIYILGGLLAFVLAARLFRHWLWGLAASALWIAAPGLVAMSIQFRPDVALSVLLIVYAYLVGRAAETRSRWHFAAAGCALGFATMVKMHAAGAVVALVIVALWRLRGLKWIESPGRPAGLVVRRHRIALAAGLTTWLALAVAFNLLRAPLELTGQQLRYGAGLAVLGAVGVQVADRFEPLAALGAGLAGIVAGLAIPITLDVPDGLQSLVNIRTGLSGEGINSGIDLFTAPLSQFNDAPLKQALMVFAIAGVAAVVGVIRRNPLPLAWFAAAAVLGVMAQARLAATHYFAPAFVLAMFGALWLFHQRGNLGAVLVWVLVAYAAWPAWDTRRGPAIEAARFAEVVAPAKAYLGAHQQPSEVTFVPSYWPFADSRWFELVQVYTAHVPDYPYRELPETFAGGDAAEQRGLRIRYYLNPQVESLGGEGQLATELGDYTVRPVAGVPALAVVIRGPGADTPLDRPDARYDPWTGYFRDPQGEYWDRKGEPISSPQRRRFLAKENVWVDVYGDLWNAEGDRVGSRPDLRTVP